VQQEVRDALAGANAVVLVIGSAYTRRLVTVYSGAARALVEAMRCTSCRRHRRAARPDGRTPPGLTDRPGTGYATAEDVVAGPYCSRDDLADMLLDQLDDTRYLHRIAAVTTPGLHVDTLQTIRRELLRR
jgi:hypothetical protein